MQNASIPKAWMSWSSGKDSAWALHKVRQNGDVHITGLMTTITVAYDRVSMHGVRRALLEAQASAVGLPLYGIEIPTPCSNEAYEAVMKDAMAEARAQGVTHIVFGDLFLEDLRAYRENKLAEVGMSAVFPLWKQDTSELAQEMILAGLKAFITCINPQIMPPQLAGHAFNQQLIDALPEAVDPCGENGEFHSFVWDGPMFNSPIAVTPGITVEREGFVFTDLLPS